MAEVAKTSLLFNYPIRFFLEKFYDFCINCFVNMRLLKGSRRDLKGGSAIDVMSILLCILFLGVSLLLFAGLIFYLYWRSVTSWSPRINQIKDGYSWNSKWPTIISLILFFTRRTFLAIVICLYDKISIFAQISFFFFIFLLTSLPTIYFKLFTSWKDYLINLLCEIPVIVLSFSLFGFQYVTMTEE